MLYHKNSQWHFCQLKVTYTDRGQQVTKYTNDKKWWLDFNEKWPHVNNLQFEYVEPTQRQKGRLEIVNIQEVPEGFISYACEFVENGRILNDDGSTPPPFQDITEDPDLDTFRQQKYAEIEQERISRTQFMPWTIPSSGTQVEVKIAEEPPGKPRQTWLSGTCSWGLACVQEGTPDELDTLIAADDSLHSMTASEWVQFGKALKLWVRDNLMAAKQHIANVQALDTAQDVIDYDYSSEWPTG
jgi:hypothetical protein